MIFKGLGAIIGMKKKEVVDLSVVGDNIMKLRKEMGLTQEELATRLGYKSKSTINKIELGINDISQSKIVRFAKALNTTPAHLMGWDEEELKAKNDVAVDIVMRMRADEEFYEVVKLLNTLDAARLSSVEQMLRSFLQ